MAKQFNLRSMEQAVEDKDELEDIFGPNALLSAEQAIPTPVIPPQFTPGFGQTPTGLPFEVMQELIASGAVTPPQVVTGEDLMSSTRQNTSLPLGTTNDFQYNPQLSLGDPGTTTPPSGHWSEQEPQEAVFQPTEYPTTPTDPAESRGLLQQIFQNPNIQRAITTGISGLGAGPYGALEAGRQFDVREAQQIKQKQLEQESAFKERTISLGEREQKERERQAFKEEQVGQEERDQKAFARLARVQLATGKVKDIKDLVDIPEDLTDRLGNKTLPIFAEQAFLHQESLKGEKAAKEAAGLNAIKVQLQADPLAIITPEQFAAAGLTPWAQATDPNARMEWNVPDDIRKTYNLPAKITVTRNEQVNYVTGYVSMKQLEASGQVNSGQIFDKAWRIVQAQVDTRSKLVQAQAAIGGEPQGPGGTLLKNYTQDETWGMVHRTMRSVAAAHNYAGPLVGMGGSALEKQPSLNEMTALVNEQIDPTAKAATVSLFVREGWIDTEQGAKLLGESGLDLSSIPITENRHPNWFGERERKIIEGVVRKTLSLVDARNAWNNFSRGKNWELANFFIQANRTVEEQEEIFAAGREEWMDKEWGGVMTGEKLVPPKKFVERVWAPEETYEEYQKRIADIEPGFFE
jgi:hypothetical protein